MKKVICPYCNSQAEYVDSIEVYRSRSYGMIYICFPCKAYVGVHKGTDRPLGRLANAELRQWKIKAHDAFDPLWKSKEMTRGKAYKWLRDNLGIPKEDCHIGKMDVAMCMNVVDLFKHRSE